MASNVFRLMVHLGLKSINLSIIQKRTTTVITTLFINTSTTAKELIVTSLMRSQRLSDVTCKKLVAIYEFCCTSTLNETFVHLVVMYFFHFC